MKTRLVQYPATKKKKERERKKRDKGRAQGSLMDWLNSFLLGPWTQWARYSGKLTS